MKKSFSPFIVAGSVLALGLLFAAIYGTGNVTLGGSPKTGGATVIQLSVSTTVTTTLSVDPRRTHLSLQYVGTSTPETMVSCAPDTNATSGYGWLLTTGSTTVRAQSSFIQTGDDTWKGKVSCVGNGAATIAVTAY